jgi:hypothetical protein
MVQCYCPGAALSAFTGADGRFSLDNVPAAQGQILLTAQKPGYSNALPVAIGTGEVRLRLMPNGKISGHVLDADGEPIRGLQLQLLFSQFVQGRRNWMPRESATTDEDGFYSFPSVTAGRYLVRTFPHEAPRSASDAPAQVYAPRYYPGVADLASAQTIQLAAGQDAATDFSLRPERAFRVSGSVSGVTQGGVPWIMLTDSDGQMANTGAALDQKTGQFTIEKVSAGSWIIAVQSNDTQGHSSSARQEITVDGSEISGLQIALQPSVTIPVNITSGSRAQVYLIPAQGNATPTYYAQSLNPAAPAGVESPLTIAYVPPGSYRLIVETSGAECLSSASSGSTDLTRDELVVSPGSQPNPIAIALDRNCGTVTGTLAASGFVVAVPQTGQGSPKFAPVTKGRPFAIAGLAPGSYEIFAFSDLNGVEYANPEALREYHGQAVVLQAGQQANVTVELNELKPAGQN